MEILILQETAILTVLLAGNELWSFVPRVAAIVNLLVPGSFQYTHNALLQIDDGEPILWRTKQPLF